MGTGDGDLEMKVEGPVVMLGVSCFYSGRCPLERDRDGETRVETLG